MKAILLEILVAIRLSNGRSGKDVGYGFGGTFSESSGQSRKIIFAGKTLRARMKRS
jgi:hypothetical protein